MSDALLTAAQMRALERAAIDSGAVTGSWLMERAGEGVVAAIEAEWPDLATVPDRAVVFCGPGNNGGDGFVVARLLCWRGWKVEVFLYGAADKLPPDARANYERWMENGNVRPLPGPPDDPAEYVTDAESFPDTAAALWIDAVFGIGQSRALPPAVAGIVKLRERIPLDRRPRLVCIDVPSGLNSDTGMPLGEQVFDADLTVTFHTRKPGHVLALGPQRCGRLHVADIGLARAQVAMDHGPSDIGEGAGGRILLAPTVRQIRAGRGADVSYPALAEILKSTGHKYDHGHALILTGGAGRTGAARLAARAALRIGAGLVTLAAPGAAMMECATQITALMLRRCDDAAALSDLLDDGRLNALCLGPGLGTHDGAGALVATTVASGRACVLDADALTLLARRDDWDLHPACVLTPHAGEFARLFPDIAERLRDDVAGYSKIDATRDAAARAGCTVLFKGPDTVIADAAGTAFVNAAVYARAAPWLATAGTGDVLAGMVAGLLARGLPPLSAATSAAWLHVEAARAFGPGLIAEDLPEMLPQVLRDLDRPPEPDRA
ncbi:NAD(P)H-hydrate dehydratase [Jannaschia sp. S6380]|uniref:NAD(P)H-hydrate dehydratase n=1 Tax=Jannaschia sp. S6380 TaxID=2926408 RepID=UPI001FF1A29F|nr:NAD(P)H-hydrate dehydratase [Jannaschia sp. S6380]MCK0167178.1 NAD(P)H-hydrate dehydratase [Jannaschia sp. S6380]